MRALLLSKKHDLEQTRTRLKNNINTITKSMNASKKATYRRNNDDGTVVSLQYFRLTSEKYMATTASART